MIILIIDIQLTVKARAAGHFLANREKSFADTFDICRGSLIYGSGNYPHIAFSAGGMGDGGLRLIVQ